MLLFSMPVAKLKKTLALLIWCMTLLGIGTGNLINPNLWFDEALQLWASRGPAQYPQSCIKCQLHQYLGPARIYAGVKPPRKNYRKTLDFQKSDFPFSRIELPDIDPVGQKMGSAIPAFLCRRTDSHAVALVMSLRF